MYVVRNAKQNVAEVLHSERSGNFVFCDVERPVNSQWNVTFFAWMCYVVLST